MQTDTNITPVDSASAEVGEMGQKYLAVGKSLSMRMWENEAPGEPTMITARAYETVGFVISGKAELHLEGDQKVTLEKGHSWVVPQGVRHAYKIIESFTAVEATSPPAQAHNRDSASQS